MKQSEAKYKRWLGLTLGLTAAGLVFFGGLTAVVDPFFHFHKPLSGLAYPIDSERYQNDGISRHFTYDAVITGTSKEVFDYYGLNAEGIAKKAAELVK